MIERLQRALEHIGELSPEMQEDIAQLIEELTEPLEDVPVPQNLSVDENLPKSVRDALALAGAWSDLKDDEFEALDRIRHESKPSLPIEEQHA